MCCGSSGHRLSYIYDFSTQRHCFSKMLYKHRNWVERFFNKIKNYKGLSARYDKLGSSFLTMLKLAAIRLWLRHNESTA